MKKFFFTLLVLMLALSCCYGMTACKDDDDCDGDDCGGNEIGFGDIFNWSVVPAPEKPVIYFYPEQTTEVTVTLELEGVLTSTYPTYENGWHIIAQPDGTLTDEGGREYYCLFWEGVQNAEYDLSRGFVVAGADTQAFLEGALGELGLTDREANEFIIYWLPRMENNAYNLITFQTDCYTDGAALNVTPTPDTVIRVFMAWTALDEPIDIEPQELIAPTRDGFTVVEWGGAELGK